MSEEEYRQKTFSYLNQIRKHLWSHREYGKAAIMVGAGFSTNANSIGLTVPPMPLWADIAKSLHEALEPGSKIETSVPAIELAAQYEERFGRIALNKQLLRLIPNDCYEPGQLHVDLLKLPWADVFTTNYDSLLERTIKLLPPERHYSVIRVMDEIVGSSQPRITKLHGSMPSHLPFVITSGDYRDYPKTFAPFVNLVQQSMMENTFCLLGFSGNDPNFTKWTEWVKENLGKCAPKLYLCTILSSDERKAIDKWERNNIAVVDLSVFECKQHSLAIGGFLTYLAQGKPMDIGDWANQNPPTGPSSPLTIEDQIKELQRLRSTYPGWVICPRQFRAKYRDNYLFPYIQTFWTGDYEVAQPDLKVQFMYEVLWGLRTCMYPLLDPVRPQLINLIEQHAEQLWPSYPHELIEIQLARLQLARHEIDAEAFELSEKSLNELLANGIGTEESKVRFFHEQCLWESERLRMEELTVRLKDWPGLNVNPIWDARRAALQLVVGQSETAWETIDSCLAEVRQRLHGLPESVELMSQEAWIMMLISRKSNTVSMESANDFRGRWIALGRYYCDPRTELSDVDAYYLFEGASEEDECEGFDPGVRHVNYRIGNDKDSIRYRELRAILTLHECAGISIHNGLSEVTRQFIAREFPDLLKRDTKFALYLALRIRSKEITSLVTRMSVAKLEAKIVEEWVQCIEGICRSWVLRHSLDPTTFRNQSPWFSLITHALEILSRLAFKASGNGTMALFGLAIELYNESEIRRQHNFYDCLSALFRRAIESIDCKHDWRAVLSLICLPLGDAEGSKLAFLARWPEPLRYLVLPGFRCESSLAIL